MSWYPIAFFPPQYDDANGAPYVGAVLKAYAAGTSTSIPMATSYTGATTASSLALNASGYPTYGGNVVIPHVQEDYKLALYPTQAAADADSGALWTVDDIQIAEAMNTPFVETFDGDGTETTFTLSEDFGNDEDILMVFADRQLAQYVTNGAFASDTGWTKGAGWTIGAGVATATGAISTDLSQNAAFPLVEGMSYTLTFTVTRSAGGVIPKLGGTAGTERTSAGTFTETIVAGSTQTIVFSGNAFTGTLDAISIKPTYNARREILRSDEFTLAGNQLTLNEAPPQGTKNVIVFAPSQLLGAANNAAAAAATSEANALAYANTAALSAATVLAVSGTSTTSNTIGTGAKTFTTQTGKAFAPNMLLYITDQATTANFMYGTVTSYEALSGALVMNITQTGGSGTIAAWNIALGGINGAFVGIASGVDTITSSVPGVAELSDGLVVFIRAAGANTSATPTLNINGTGDKTITKLGGAALVAGNIYGALFEGIYKYNAANTRWELLNPYDIPTTTPTVTRLTSGSGTYSLPAGAKYGILEMVAGGGGGGGAGAGGATGGTGGTTSFGTWTTIGGSGGFSNIGEVAGGAGGTGGVDGTGTLIKRVAGNAGGSCTVNATYTLASEGGGSALMAGASRTIGQNTNGLSPPANTGAGASGATDSGTVATGSGGGGGEYVKFKITSASSVAYSIGAGGAAGAGNHTGGVGSAGCIEITEYY